MAVLRRAAAAIQHASSAAAPPRAASIHHTRSAAAPPRAASIHHTRSAATPRRAASSIYHAKDVARFTGLTRTAAPPRAASSIYNASDVARFTGLTRADAPPRTASSIYHSSDVARFTGITRTSASFRAPAGLLDSAPARFGVPSGSLTRATAPTGIRCIHLLAVRPIAPRVQIELRRLDSGVFRRYKEIEDAIQQLSLKLSEEEAATLQYITEQIVHVGTVSWRVCTTVLTAAVAAGFGVVQLAKSGWEEEFHRSACSLITARLAETKSELENYMVKAITHRRNVAVANAFLENEKKKERNLMLEEREAVLVAKEADLLAREAILAAKEAVPVKVSFWRWMQFWSG